MYDAPNRSSSPDHSETRAILALSLVPDVGPVKHQQLVARFGSASRALDCACPPSQSTEAYAGADRQLARSVKAGLSLMTIADDDYPELLSHSHDPPPVLWYRGDLSCLRQPLVAVVGTRRATSYGLRATREIVSALARAGAAIVSGMALGIDAAAHRHALESGAKTIAVLGTGADVAYPRAHVALHRELAERGLVVSEMAPGDRSNPGSFPRRNRIIAALASLTIVIEAPLASGALITSGVAMELGRDVAAVPGPINSPQSAGSNELLREGAHVVTSASAALRLAGLYLENPKQPLLSDDTEIKVWAALEHGAATLDDLCARARLPVAQCLTAVTGLELRGVIECALTGEVRRR